MVTPLYRPSVRVNQLFARVAAAAGEDLGAFIYGPAAAVYRYAVAAEKAVIFGGSYDPVGSYLGGSYRTLINFPSRPAGGVIDASFTRLFCDNAFLRVFEDTSGDAYRVGRNRVRSPNDIFSTANGYSSTISDSGLAVGMRVLIEGTDEDEEAFSLATYITGFAPDYGSSSNGAAVAASSNKGSATTGATTSTVAVTGGVVIGSASAAAYNGLAAGLTGDVYTITVVTGGTAGNTRLRITSASGMDNAASVTPAALDSPTSIGSFGATVTFTDDSSSLFAVGDTWTLTVARTYAAPTVTLGGTYTGSTDRDYIVEVLNGGLLVSGTVRVRVTSRDGSDSGQSILLTEPTSNNSQIFSLGSYGLTCKFVAATGLVTGSKWTVAATAAPAQRVRTLILAHDFPENVADDDTAALNIQVFTVTDVEIPARSATPGTYNFESEATQISVAAGIELYDADWTLSGDELPMQLLAPSGFGDISKLYIQYRAWLPVSSDITTITASDDLDTFLDGPTDPDNPLKYALSLARGAAGSQPVRFFAVGNPASLDGWESALTLSTRLRSAYGHAPLTDDQDVLSLVNSHVLSMNGADTNYYRVLWFGARKQVGEALVDMTKTSDDELALAVVEDDAGSTGTQYTQVRLTSGNADFLALGVRAGDRVRYSFEVDGWDDETYVTRVVDRVLSATTLTVTEAFVSGEAVPKRVEIHRTFNAAEAKAAYQAEVGLYSSDVARAIVAPNVHIGSYVLPSYFVAPILAGLRSSIPAQQTMSGMVMSQIASVTGLELFTESQLAEISGAGGTVVNYEPQSGQVIVYRAVTTTGDMDIITKREESMVACRHANLFAIVDRLKVYAGNSNITDVAGFTDDLSEMIISELKSLTKALQRKNYTPALLGQIIDLEITFIGPSAIFEDVLDIAGTMTLGRPTNRIDFSVLIQ